MVGKSSPLRSPAIESLPLLHKRLVAVKTLIRSLERYSQVADEALSRKRRKAA
jgi:hypothetical protein